VTINQVLFTFVYSLIVEESSEEILKLISLLKEIFEFENILKETSDDDIDLRKELEIKL